MKWAALANPLQRRLRPQRQITVTPQHCCSPKIHQVINKSQTLKVKTIPLNRPWRRMMRRWRLTKLPLVEIIRALAAQKCPPPTRADLWKWHNRLPAYPSERILRSRMVLGVSVIPVAMKVAAKRLNRYRIRRIRRQSKRSWRQWLRLSRPPMSPQLPT